MRTRAALAQGKTSATTRILMFSLAALTPAVLAPPESQAMHLKHVYSFCHDEIYCPDGRNPDALIQDSAGNLFGTTQYGGGAFDTCGIACGTAFELKHHANGDYGFIQLYNFCAEQNCADGAEPQGNLIISATGNLYGTTSIGGAAGGGAVYELMPQKGGWQLKVLYSFCPTGHDCVDGVAPVVGLTYANAATGAPYDGTSPLFGTTTTGGTGGSGVAYELQLASGVWSETVLHNFCSAANCADGATPKAPLAMDAAGNLYGTTEAGGNSTNSGTVFQLSQNRGMWSETLLHAFCSQKNCRDGSTPLGGVTLDPSGALYGVTPFGGKCHEANGCGLLYRLVDNGSNWEQTVLYDFCKSRFCDDGSFPYAPPTIDAAGNLFGTATEGGGPSQRGTAYEFSGGVYKRIKRFCPERHGCSADYPAFGVIVDAGGHIFGAAYYDGNHSYGTVFELSP